MHGVCNEEQVVNMMGTLVGLVCVCSFKPQLLNSMELIYVFGDHSQNSTLSRNRENIIL